MEDFCYGKKYGDKNDDISHWMHTENIDKQGLLVMRLVTQVQGSITRFCSWWIKKGTLDSSFFGNLNNLTKYSRSNSLAMNLQSVSRTAKLDYLSSQSFSSWSLEIMLHSDSRKWMCLIFSLFSLSHILVVIIILCAIYIFPVSYRVGYSKLPTFGDQVKNFPQTNTNNCKLILSRKLAHKPVLPHNQVRKPTHKHFEVARGI